MVEIPLSQILVSGGNRVQRYADQSGGAAQLYRYTKRLATTRRRVKGLAKLIAKTWQVFGDQPVRGPLPGRQ